MGGNPPLSFLWALLQITKSASSLKHQDFRITIEDASKGSFIYADPPYFTSNRADIY